MKNKDKWLPLAALLLSLSPAVMSAQAQGLQRQISVNGTARMKGIPSVALVQAGHNVQAKTAKDALEQNAQVIKKVLAGLKELGIDEKDISSSSINLQPVIEYSGKNVPRVTAYEASHQLSIRFRDIANLGSGLDKLVAAGANSIGDVQLIVPNMPEKYDEARKSAVLDAKRKAEVLLSSTGAKLGRVITLHESGGGMSQPRVRAMNDMAMKSAAMPIAAGEQSEELNVSVTWEIVD